MKNTEQEETVQGRSIFIVGPGEKGIEVLPALLINEKDVVVTNGMVFPDLGYALQQVEELKQHLINHFSQAARLGAAVAHAASVQSNEVVELEEKTTIDTVVKKNKV